MNRTYIIGALVVFVVLAVMIAFSSLPGEPVAPLDHPTETQPVASQMPTQIPPVYGTIGERIEAQGVAITVTGVEWTQSSDGTPADGNRVLLVHVIVENTNPTFELAVSGGDFQIRRSNGLILDFSPKNVVYDQLGDITLASNQEQTETVAFELPQSQEPLHLLYDYNDQHIDIDLSQ